MHTDRPRAECCISMLCLCIALPGFTSLALPAAWLLPLVLPLIAASPLPSVARAIRLYGCRMRYPPKDPYTMRSTLAVQ